MTILRDGEKFACKQCIQGHRVSTCHHEERPLLHVARKGRPVSQCVHCRGLRKARQTHIKCDCGERRHSRTTSSESNTIGGSDAEQCQCSSGKKCTCALKKDSKPDGKLNVPLGPFIDRSTGKPFIPNRRSESAIPSSRNTYQPALQRANISPPEYPSSYTMTASHMRRGHHGTQRSVDSLPLLSSSSSTSGQPFLSPVQGGHGHLLAPGPIPPQRSQSDHLLQVASTQDDFRNFNVDLDQDVLARTLSPQNPKRYSMNDWSMMTFNVNDSPQLALDHNRAFESNEPSGFPFPSVARQAQDRWNNSSLPAPAMRHMPPPCDTNFPSQPDLSTSSTGTVSDFGDVWQFDQQAPYSSPQLTITLDQTPCHQPTYDEEKSNFSWAPVSYQDMQADFGFSSDPVLPSYSQGYGGDEYVPQQALVDPKDFTFPAAQHSRQSSVQDLQYHNLPDRSMPRWPASSEPTLNTAFKFPQTNDLCFSQPYSTHVEQRDWQFNDDNNYLEIVDHDSPLAR